MVRLEWVMLHHRRFDVQHRKPQIKIFEYLKALAYGIGDATRYRFRKSGFDFTPYSICDVFNMELHGQSL